MEAFTTLSEARQLVETWRGEYNESRPHRALGEKMPNEFANEIAASRDLIELQTYRGLALGLVQKSRSDQNVNSLRLALVQKPTRSDLQRIAVDLHNSNA